MAVEESQAKEWEGNGKWGEGGLKCGKDSEFSGMEEVDV